VAERVTRRGIDQFLARVAGIVLHGFFRELSVAGRDRLPAEGPTLVVLNHFNGLVDPIVAVHALGRLPRFLAKATLWKVVVARPFLALAGLIPVYRAEDRKIDRRNAAGGNVSAFTECHEVLRDGGTIAIFPEGTTSARSKLAPVKTGAARIALGAVAEGIEGLVIVPVGLAYEDRVAFRGRAYAEVGEPLDITAELSGFVALGEEVSEDNHNAVDRITEEIDARLRACSPDFETPREEATLQLAAKVALRPNGPTEHEPSFGEVEQTARRLADTGAETREDVIASVADYALDLRLSHLQDAEITPGPGLARRFRKAVATVILLVVLSPIIVVGLLANIVPFLLVRVASRRVRVPVTKGTVRVLVGFAVFPITWIVLAIIFADDYRAVLLFVALPVLGFIALWALETAVLNWRMLSAWRAARGERRWFAEQLREDRAALARKVHAVLDGSPDADVLSDQAP
jgi:glycerol-3-phosphate O-acyltransferase / dihydroxyacetone phosphate acyltransferase